MNTWTLYEHVSPSGKKYVGVTSMRPESRWEGGSGYRPCKAFYKAIQKYGWDNFKHNIIAGNLGEKTAKNMEKDLIAFNKAKGISYNITDGGDGSLGRPCSELRREMTRNIWKGKKIPRDIVEKSAAKRRGIQFSKEHREKIGIGKLGNGHGNKVVIEIENGKIVNEYKSCVEAARLLGVPPNSISRCCRRETQTCKKRVFIYKKDLELFHTILNVDIVEKNPYVQNESSKFVKIVK